MATEIISCWNCQQKVRIDKEKIQQYQNAQCGKCKKPLFGKKEEPKTTGFDYRSLNNSAQQPEPSNEPRDVEAYLKQELQKGVNGNPQRLKANYEKLQKEIEVKKVKLEVIARQHDGVKRAELEGQAQAKIGRLTQILNDLYFQQTASFDLDLAPLPPEPVYRGPSMPMSFGTYNTIANYSASFTTIAGVVIGLFAGIPNVAVLSMGAGLVAGFFMGKFFEILFVASYNINKKTNKYNQAVDSFRIEHAEWLKLKEHHDLLKNKTRGRDELDKYL